MYIDRDIVYSDSGKYLKAGNRYAYQFPSTVKNIEEIEDTLTGFIRKGNIIEWENGLRVISIIKDGTYESYKTMMIKTRYSNDDQLAIILNKDSGEEEDLIAFQRMQEWRDYAASVARKIMEVLN